MVNLPQGGCVTQVSIIWDVWDPLGLHLNQKDLKSAKKWLSYGQFTKGRLREQYQDKFSYFEIPSGLCWPLPGAQVAQKGPLTNFSKNIYKIYKLNFFVSALAFPSQKTLKHLQKVVNAVRNFVNALAFPSQKTLKHLQNFVSGVLVL